MGYRDRGKRLFGDNRGFTLVELLVAVALVAVVGTAVFGFMTVGSKTFASTSSEVNLQSESQLAFNQMQDMIIDTVVGIDYGYLPAGSALDVYDWNSYTGNWVTTIPAGTACEAKKLVMYNLDKVYEITWVSDDNKLYYTEYNTDPSSTDVVVRQGASVVGNALMAEYVTDFNADLSLMQSKRIVRLETTYEKSGKEYTSSHNITLRNKPLSGNSIPDYVAPTLDKIPQEIIGDNEVFVKPGETLQMKLQPMVDAGHDLVDGNGTVLAAAPVDTSIYKGYVIRYDPADYPFMDPAAPQHIRFSIRSGQSGCYSAVDPVSGELTISPAQANDFQVTVTGEVGIYTVVKPVWVRMLRVESVTISFEPDNSTAVGASVSQNGLKTGEAFTLSANVVAYEGRTTQISDASGSAIDFSVNWDKTKGSALFDIVSGTQTGPNAGVSKCKFKMNEVTATALDIEVTATSKESVSLGYTNYSGVLTPVVGKFTGTTYKKPDDPKKKFDQEPYNGKWKRGEPYVVKLTHFGEDGETELANALKLKDGTTLDLSKGLVKVVEVKAEETVYTLAGANPTTDITADALNYGEILIKDGSGWKFNCPPNYNPNATYRYVIKHKIYKAPDPEWTDSSQNFYTMEELRQMYTNAGMTLNEERDLVAEGNGVDATFPRLQAEFYETNSTPTEYFRINTKNNRYDVKYYPRSFNTTQPAKSFEVAFTFHNSFDRFDNNFQAEMTSGSGGGVLDFTKEKYRCYRPEADGQYKYGISSDNKVANKIDETVTKTYETNVPHNFMSVGDWFNPKQAAIGSTLRGFKMEFKAYENKTKDWEKVERQFRMVPVVTVKGSGGGRYDGDYVLFDSFIEFNNWNIEIPGTGLIATLLNINQTSAAERSYFPLPGDYNFPGETGKFKANEDGRDVWTEATQWSGSCCGYTNFNHPQNIYFTLVPNGSNWRLTLFAQANTAGKQKWIAFARYNLNQDGTEWVMDTGFNYDKDTAPILDK